MNSEISNSEFRNFWKSPRIGISTDSIRRDFHFGRPEWKSLRIESVEIPILGDFQKFLNSELEISEFSFGNFQL